MLVFWTKWRQGPGMASTTLGKAACMCVLKDVSALQHRMRHPRTGPCLCCVHLQPHDLLQTGELSHNLCAGGS
jgi:hypothetical protein